MLPLLVIGSFNARSTAYHARSIDPINLPAITSLMMVTRAMTKLGLLESSGPVPMFMDQFQSIYFFFEDLDATQTSYMDNMTKFMADMQKIPTLKKYQLIPISSMKELYSIDANREHLIFKFDPNLSFEPEAVATMIQHASKMNRDEYLSLTVHQRTVFKSKYTTESLWNTNWIRLMVMFFCAMRLFLYGAIGVRWIYRPITGMINWISRLLFGMNLFEDAIPHPLFFANAEVSLIPPRSDHKVKTVTTVANLPASSYVKSNYDYYEVAKLPRIWQLASLEFMQYTRFHAREMFDFIIIVMFISSVQNTIRDWVLHLTIRYVSIAWLRYALLDIRTITLLNHGIFVIMAWLALRSVIQFYSGSSGTGRPRPYWKPWLMDPRFILFTFTVSLYMFIWFPAYHVMRLVYYALSI